MGIDHIKTEDDLSKSQRDLILGLTNPCNGTVSPEIFSNIMIRMQAASEKAGNVLALCDLKHVVKKVTGKSVSHKRTDGTMSAGE
jgi:hypothetical protein